MANTKIDFKAAAMKAAGHAAGAAAYTQLNKLQFMQNQTNPKIKGLITAAVGYIGIPMLAAKAKLGGKGSKADFLTHVGEGMAIVGVMQLANSFVPATAGKPALFPQITGVGDDVAGLGLISQEEEPEEISGYENNPMRIGDMAEDNNVVVRM